MSDKALVVTGLSPFIASALAIARECEPEREISVLELKVRNRLEFDTSALAALDPALQEVFVALDYRAVNFSRLELMSQLKARGFSLARLVSPRAFVAPGQKLGENTIVHMGTMMSCDVRVGYNAVIGSRATIEIGVKIGNSAYLAPGTMIEAQASIGDSTTIGEGVTVASGVKVGKQCEILIPGIYREDIPDKTFYALGYAGPVRIVKF